MISSHFAGPPRRAGAAPGFTLIELMVVVAIVAILAAIAIPNYAAYVQRSRIIAATSGLGDFRVRMEQFYLDNRSYRNAGNTCGIPNPPNTASDPFWITCATANANSYVVTATGQAALNMQNFVYTINQNGVKATTSLPGGWTNTPGCWVVRKDGTCV